jgi:hypothetical protein
MPATEEQADEMAALRAEHERELATLDREYREKRHEMQTRHDAELNDLYRAYGARK